MGEQLAKFAILWVYFTKYLKKSRTVSLREILGPIPSMYGRFINMYHKNQPYVGKYTIHAWYGGAGLKHVFFTPIWGIDPI